MNSKTDFIVWIAEIWLKRRWLILAMLVIFSALFETYELLAYSSYFDDPVHLAELAVHGVILPIVLITLQRTETQRNNAINSLALHDSFVDQLNRIRDWNELIQVIAQFPQNIVPLSGVDLLMRLPNSNKFDLELARTFEASVHQMTDSRAPLEMGNIECNRAEINRISGVRLCNCPFQLQSRENGALYKKYCLPLSNANSIIGLLHLYLSASYKLMKEQKDFLDRIVPEIVISLNKALLQRKSILQDAAFETERLRLASDLHDTLGQDLAYLRNKIDQLIHDDTFRRASIVKRELNQMRIVAEEANQTVRNILTVTHSDQETVLDARLLAYARAIGERANFNISLDSEGQPHTLSPHMQFQIFLIFREILANIEKHARARQVMIALTWSDEELAMAISDDGRGFLTNHLDKNDHFGLTIIETRTREMNGRMLVASAPNEGTKVSIWLPIDYGESYPSDRIDNP